jgi:hypothetical protein
LGKGLSYFLADRPGGVPEPGDPCGSRAELAGFQFFEREIAFRPDPDGALCGSKTESFSVPAQLLTRIAEKVFKNPESFGEWGVKQNRQFQTLTHPEHPGHAFRG